MQFLNNVKQTGANLLNRALVQPIVSVGAASLHEVTDATHQLVHAVEQPIQNVVNDSKVVVGGLYNLTQGIMHLAPYWVGGWLLWTFFEMYFPREKRAVTGSLNSAAKRMRLM